LGPLEAASGSLRGPIGTEDRLYGLLGEIVQESRAIPIQGGRVPTYTTQFTFDIWNRTAQMVYPDQPTGEVLKYAYDGGGLVKGVVSNDDQLETFYARSIAYDKFGQRLSMTNGQRCHHHTPTTRCLTPALAHMAPRHPEPPA
jgi:YD repeat-containing protein